MSDTEDLPRLAPGLYVDGWWGQYTAARALQFAITEGWPGHDIADGDVLTLGEFATTKLETMGTGSWPEHLDASRIEYIEESIQESLPVAEEWLTEHRAPEDHFFGPHPEAGSWGCWHYSDFE